MSNIDLKPCPLCGGVAKAFHVGTSTIIRCVGTETRNACGLRLEKPLDADRTIKAWNHRDYDDEMTEVSNG